MSFRERFQNTGEILPILRFFGDAKTGLKGTAEQINIPTGGLAIPDLTTSLSMPKSIAGIGIGGLIIGGIILFLLLRKSK